MKLLQMSNILWNVVFYPNVKLSNHVWNYFKKNPAEIKLDFPWENFTVKQFIEEMRRQSAETDQQAML